MPKIPMGSDPGVRLGEARYEQSIETPDMGRLGRRVPREVGPKLEVNKLDVVEQKAAPLSQFKPVPPGNEGDIIQQGFDKLSQRADQFAAFKQEELRQVNEAAEKTSLLVTIGDQKAAYTKDTLDIINSSLSNEDKAKELQKREDDFRATIQEAKPQYQPVVASEVMSTIGSVKNKAQDVFLRNQQDSIKADLETRANQLTLDAASTGDINGSLAHFDALQGAYKSAGLTDAHFVSDRLKFEQGILQNDIMGVLKSTDVKSGVPALEAVNSLLARLTDVDEKNVPTNWTRLSPATRNADVAAVIQKKNQIEADLLRQAEKEKTRIDDFIKIGLDSYERTLKEGYNPDPKLIIGLQNAIQQKLQTDPDKLAGYTYIGRYQDITKKYGPDYRWEQKADDPLFGTGVQPFTFADVSSPDAFQSKIAQNFKMGMAVKEKEHLNHVPLIRKDDAGAITRMFSSNPQSGMQLVESLGALLGENAENSIKVMGAQVASSKTVESAVVSQIIGHMAKGDKETAATLADGMQALKNGAIKKPLEVDFQAQFNSYVGSAYSEAGDVSRQNYEAFKAAYMSMASRKGLVDGTMDRDTARKALRDVIGPVTTFNGSTVLLPDNKNENQFREYVYKISPETVQAWGGIHGMTNEKAADFIKEDAQLKQIGATRYVLVHAGKQVNSQLKDQRGVEKPFVIDTKMPLISPMQTYGNAAIIDEIVRNSQPDFKGM